MHSRLCIQNLSTETVPTFNGDIAPIIYEESVQHRRHPGGLAAVILLTYDDVKQRAGQIADVTSSRYMPPWLPEPGYGNFAGGRRLGTAEIDLIRQWAASGTAEGDSKDIPTPPRFRDGWQLGEPDLIIRMREVYTLSASGDDVFRNFVIPIPRNIITGPRYVRGMRILPGNKRIVHHANIIVDRSGEARRRDAADPEVGFGGMDINIANVELSSLRATSSSGNRGAAEWDRAGRYGMAAQQRYRSCSQYASPAIGKN